MSINDNNNMRIYNQIYYELHKDDRKLKTICDICKGSYNTNSKYYHFKSKKHLNALVLEEKDKKLAKLNNKLKLIQDKSK